MVTLLPKLRRVMRLDSLPLGQTYFTEEGYLVDRPVLTSTGIFEYTNSDGSIRRELRLPEEVFAPESLKSYKGKPIIITHDAGLITKDNVHDNGVGTILSEGYRSGNDVRAEIIIHDTDEMKSSGLKELSLGYNLDLEETPGVWNGQPYDAIQRNIIINHLALVLEARAGEQARLNIDGRDRELKGAKKMSTNPKKTTKRARRGDGTLPPEEFAKAIEEYKARRAQRLAAKADEGEEGVMKTPLNEARAADADEDMTPNTGTEAQAGEIDTEKQLQMVKDRRDRRDAEGDPEDKEAAIGVIAQQDGDMDILFDIIDTLLAERDFGGNTATDGTGCKKDEDDVELMEGDADDINPMPGENENEDEDELEEGADMDEDLLEGEKIDADDETIPKATAGELLMNADSVDYIVRQRIQLGIVGRVLNMDGLENMRIMDAKKAVIRAVRPDMRLDGKSAAYINAAFDCAVSDVKSSKRKDTSYQRKQMFNRDSRSRSDSSDAARSRMIERRLNNNKEGK